MEKYLLKLCVTLLICGGVTLFASAQGALSTNNTDVFARSQGLWRDTAEASIAADGKRTVEPKAYRVLALDLNVLSAMKSRAPMEGSAMGRSAPLQIVLPLPDGTSGRFNMVESPVMAPELAAKFPEITTWSGQGVDDPSATVKVDWTPQGFHAMILSATTGRIFIDPYSRSDTKHYISYFTRDHDRPASKTFVELPVQDPGGVKSAEIKSLLGKAAQRTSGTQLRTYRLAVAATGEYSAFHGGTVSGALGAIATTFNRVNGIYEAEVAVRMVLVGTNDQIIYTNAATDPYTNSSGGAMLAENQANIDARIGSGNYDIGHVVSTGGGGVANLGVPCVAGWKARGVTGSSSPIGDSFDVDYVAHEVGHQFGGNHTFNSVSGSCGAGNRSTSTAYEPGSGSTIMAYAGICGADNLQPNSDPYFHSVSFDEIATYTNLSSGSSCGVVTSTSNSIPVPLAPAGGFTIPARTPFALTGSATDANADSLTYNWEEYDLGTGGAPGNSLNPPFFRTWPATSSPTRTFPRLSNLLNNTTVVGEVLPNVSRAMAFRMTVRDNRSGGGGVAYAPLSFNVTTAAGPFQVTAPNTALTWNGGTSQSVTWNVANTDLAPVNCSAVNISLSTDGGLTFPTSLANGVANNGSAAVTVPNSATTSARVKVACSGSIFFAMSGTSFSIVAGSTFGLSVSRVGSGSVISADGGINCGTTCSANYASGAPVTLTATPNTGATFLGWGGSCSGTASTCSVSMSSARSVSASFSVVNTPPVCTLSASPSTIAPGGSATLSSTCSPAATSYTWQGGTCAGTTGSSCTVSPAATTTYSVLASNATGSGAAALATVTVSTGGPVELPSDPTYRFANAITGGHFFTSNESEKSYVLANLPSYRYEGIAFKVSLSQIANSLPVQRFSNRTSGFHYFSIDSAEQAILASNPAYTLDGTAYYAYPTQVSGSSPLYRFRNSYSGAFFWTANAVEKDYVVNNLPAYVYQGISFYVVN